MSIRALLPQTNENVAYHAARILVLIAVAGKPQHSNSGRLPGIKGRTLLAKLDFFTRYPTYLSKAGEIRGEQLTTEDLGIEALTELETVESSMVRYLYGPWDHVYYITLGYLIGKGLIIVELEGGTEVFRVSPSGSELAARLQRDPAFGGVATRARTVYRFFNAYSGSRLKNFIYDHFPEVVNRKIGDRIS